MKVVDAYWEKRNLGVSTTKFIIEDHDTIDEIKENLSNCNSHFQVLRLPYNLTQFLFLVQDLGFRFVEDVFSLKNDLQPIFMSPIVERLHKEITFDFMNDVDIKQLMHELELGMFKDYIYIDPFFDTKLACKRYCNWAKDELERGSLFFKYVYKGKTIGFNSLKDRGNGAYDAVLGGLYSDYQKSGLGSAVFVADIVKHLGGKFVTAEATSNNTRQIRNLTQKGFAIISSCHVFIKHVM